MTRRHRRLLTAGATLLVAATAAGVALWPRLVPREAPRAATSPAAAPAGRDQATLLLVRAPAEGGPAESVTLLATGPEPDRAVVVFLPVAALVGIPGHGLDRLGQAQAYGGPVLVEAAVENTLGIDVDHTALVSDTALGSWLDRVGGLDVRVPQRLVERDDDGSVTLRFAAGLQTLDGPRLVEYWRFRGRDEDELMSLPRQQLVWEALLDAVRHESAMRRLMARGVPQLDTAAGPSWLRRLFDGLAASRAADGLVFSLLPVEPFGGAGEQGGQTYRVRDAEAARLSSDLFAASAGDRDRRMVRVEVLNGVGTPGIGQRVHARLGGEGYRIVRTDNARSFDFAETRILVYDEAYLPVARRLRSLLGVGSIMLSRRSQSVVDLTVVIGADFLDTEGEAT